MNSGTFHPDRPDHPLDYGAADPLPANFGRKLRPASHTYAQPEGTYAWALIILALAAMLVVTKVWLIELLG